MYYYLNKKLLRYLLYGSLLLIFTGCSFFQGQSPVDKVDKKPDELPYKQVKPDNLPYKQENPVDVPPIVQDNDFVTLTTNTPCWVNNPPKNCDNYKTNPDILISVYIETSNDELSEEQRDKISSKLYVNYLIFLKQELKKAIKEEPACNGEIKEYKCTELRQQYFFQSEPKHLKDQFEFKDEYIASLGDNRNEHHILGCLKNRKHQQAKQNIIEYIRNNLPKPYVPVTSPEVKWLE